MEAKGLMKQSLAYDIADIKKFLNLEDINLMSKSFAEQIKELCVAKLCYGIGIKCGYNYKSDFFEFFSSIMGEAMCEKFELDMHVASEELRYVKYEHCNLVNQARIFLEQDCLDEGFIDAFNFIDKYRYLIPYLKQL